MRLSNYVSFQKRRDKEILSSPSTPVEFFWRTCLKIPPLTTQNLHSAGGREGFPIFFYYLGAHAKFCNPTITPFGRKVMQAEEEREKRR
jgi:hypothetical protein